jgi:hypothetical protein
MLMGVLLPFGTDVVYSLQAILLDCADCPAWECQWLCLVKLNKARSCYRLFYSCSLISSCLSVDNNHDVADKDMCVGFLLMLIRGLCRLGLMSCTYCRLSCSIALTTQPLCCCLAGLTFCTFCRLSYSIAPTTRPLCHCLAGLTFRTYCRIDILYLVRD